MVRRWRKGGIRRWGRSEGCGEGWGGVHEFFELFGRVVFELLEVKLRFVSNGHAVADYVCRAGRGRLDVVGHVDCFIVGALDHFTV